MAVTEIYTGLLVDDELEDGYVQIERTGRKRVSFTMTRDTWWALESNDVMAEMYAALEDRPAGTYLLPRSVIERHALRELELGLSMVEPEPSVVCVHPPCGQDAVTDRDGYPLCQIHLDLMQSWDDLIA